VAVISTILVLLSLATALAAPLPQAAVSEPDAAVSEPDAAVSDISFEEIDELFGVGGSLTALQKDERWKEYKGKCVEWSGKLALLEETFGEFRIGFKHGRVSRISLSNVWIFAPQAAKETLLDWQQGSTYVYRATLRSAPHTIVPLIADWGCVGVEDAP
jgi:hypothetical protein